MVEIYLVEEFHLVGKIKNYSTIEYNFFLTVDIENLLFQQGLMCFHHSILKSDFDL
jgi:hypothetical protein